MEETRTLHRMLVGMTLEKHLRVVTRVLCEDNVRRDLKVINTANVISIGFFQDLFQLLLET
jgi:hypothetical protein